MPKDLDVYCVLDNISTHKTPAVRAWLDHNVDELIQTISSYPDRRNLDPKPFVWTATVKSILAKVAKAKETFATLH